MMIDTGCPFEVLIDLWTARSMSFGTAPNRISTNFGIVAGYIMQMEIPSISYSRRVLCWTNARVGRVLSAEGFDGMIGLTALRGFISYKGDTSLFTLEY
jgi:hypothetical protein